MAFTRGARITGAALCAVLAALAAAWIVRDLRAAEEPLDLWWFWAGDGRTAVPARRLTTTLQDPVLLVGYVVVGVAALRSRVAAAALVAAGVVTLAVRLPGLWLLSAVWMDLRATDELRSRALVSVFVALGIAVGLLITAAAGRRPAESPYGVAPIRPSHGVSVTAFLLLATVAGIRAAWEVYWTSEIPASSYADRFTGSANLMLPLLGPPPGWLNAAVVLICLAAAGGALFHAVYSRPLGLAAAGLLIASGATGLALAIRFELIGGFGDLPVRDQLAVGSWTFELVAGVAVLLVLARRGVSDAAGGPLPQG
ncbi:hypothetical protein ACWGI8_43925, partial [Streptomyces sp. NPDC054841]